MSSCQHEVKTRNETVYLPHSMIRDLLAAETSLVLVDRKQVESPYPLCRAEYLVLTGPDHWVSRLGRSVPLAAAVFILTVFGKWVYSLLSGEESKVEGYEVVVLILLCAFAFAFWGLGKVMPSDKTKLRRKMGEYFKSNTRLIDVPRREK